MKVNIRGIPNYEMLSPFVDENFRFIADDNNDNRNDSEENNVESDNDESNFIYDEEKALVVEWAKRWFEQFEIIIFLKSFIRPPNVGPPKYKYIKKSLQKI